jgi:predicted dehydrogenase
MSGSIIKVLIVGAGDIGMSHLQAYNSNPNFSIVGVVDIQKINLPDSMSSIPIHENFEIALKALNPDLVAICTYSNTHAEYAKIALNFGAHIFVEEPWALSLKDAKDVLATAQKAKRQLIIGHILSYDPIWNRFVVEARNLGGPYVIRMAANQQADAQKWELHKRLLLSAPPIVDSGVHFAYIMCKITESKPVKVHAIGLRLSEELNPKIYNYGQMQVTFSDGSIAWFEAGWGPMMSKAGKLVRDVVCPSGSVSVVNDEYNDITMHNNIKSSNALNSAIIVRQAKPSLKDDHQFDWDPFSETRLPFTGKMSQDILCEREQNYVHRAITENHDLKEHHRDAMLSLEICLAAHRSISTGKSVHLT